MNIALLFGALGILMIVGGLMALLSKTSDPAPKKPKSLTGDYAADQILYIMNGSMAGSEPDENDENVPLSSM